MHTNTNVSLKDLSPNDLLVLGLNDIAYLKPAVVDGKKVFAIHAADGSQLAFVESKEVGLAAMQQHDLEPVSLH